MYTSSSYASCFYVITAQKCHKLRILLYKQFARKITSTIQSYALWRHNSKKHYRFRSRWTHHWRSACNCHSRWLPVGSQQGHVHSSICRGFATVAPHAGAWCRAPRSCARIQSIVALSAMTFSWISLNPEFTCMFFYILDHDKACSTDWL